MTTLTTKQSPSLVVAVFRAVAVGGAVYLLAFAPALRMQCSSGSLGGWDCGSGFGGRVALAGIGVITAPVIEAWLLRKDRYRHALLSAIAAQIGATVASIWATRPLFNAFVPYSDLYLIVGAQFIGVPVLLLIFLWLSGPRNVDDQRQL